MKKLLVLLMISVIVLSTGCNRGNGTDENLSEDENISEDEDIDDVQTDDSKIDNNQEDNSIPEGNNEVEKPEITENPIGMNILANLPELYVYMPFNHINYTIYNSFTSMRYFTVPIISSRAISDEEATIDLGIETPYTYSLTEIKKEDFPYYLYLCYKDVNWDNMFYDKFLDEFNKLDTSKWSEIRYYRAEIALNLDSDMLKNEEITQLSLITRKNSFTFNVGSIKLDYETRESFDGNSLMFSSFIIGDVPMSPSALGTIDIPELSFTTENDITLKDINVYNAEGVKVESVRLNIEKGDSITTVEYNTGDLMKMEAGLEVTAAITLSDANMANLLDYSSIYNIVFVYEDGNETYQQHVEVSTSTKRGFYEHLCEEVDSIDLSKYYFGYLSKTNELSQ